MHLVTLLTLLALVALPGVGAVLALPARVSLPTRLALVFGFGYAVVGGVAYALTIAGVLGPATFLPLYGLATVALWVVAARRGIGRQWRAIRDEVAADRGPLLVGLLVLAAIGAIWLGYLGTFRTISPYRYWVDGMEIADAGGIPSATLHYGRLFPPVTSKIFLNAFTAAADYVSFGRVLPAVNAMLWITAVGTGAALWAVGRELGARSTAALLPVLLLANRLVLGNDMSRDLAGYRAEIVGRMVAFSALALAIRAIRDRPAVREAMLAGALFGAAAGTHLVPTLVSGGFLAAYVLALAIVQREPRAIAKHAAVVAALTAVVGGAVLLLPSGEVGFEGAGRPEAYERVEFDKTQFLYDGSMRPARDDPGPYLEPGAVVQQFVGRSLGVGGPLRSPPAILLLGLGAIALAAGSLLRCPRDLRAAIPAAVGLAAVLVAGAAYFGWRYDLFIPATFGVRRLFDYAALPAAIVAVVLLEAGARALARFDRRAPVAAGVGVVLLGSAILMPTARVGADSAAEARHAAALVDWIRTDTPCDARILVNQRTVGILRAMTGRAGVLEGMGPFLRPRMLDEIVDLLLRARRFFAEPAANRAFLEREGVDLVIAMKGFRIGHVPEVGNADPSLLRGVPFLRPVHSNPVADVYEVVGVRRVDGFPTAVGQPGYRCATEPVER